MINNFEKFSKQVRDKFDLLSSQELYTVDDPENKIWELYLASFPEGSNPIFQTRAEHDCSCCKSFIRNVGNIVAIVNGKLETIWGLENVEYPYADVANALDKFVKSLAIKNIFRVSERSYGNLKTRQTLGGNLINWNHFFSKIDNKHFSSSVATKLGESATTAQVFKRGLEEFTTDALDTVMDLIASKSIYRAEEFETAVKEFRKLRTKYLNLKTGDKNIFIWENINSPYARFRATVIGTLVEDLSNGKDLDKAVGSYEAKVAPTNYKRPTASITPRMIQDALKTLKELDLETAIERRFAKLSDVSVNNVLWVDNSVKGKMKDGIEGLLLDAVKPQKFDEKDAQDISIADFMSTVVPKSTSMEILVKNNHLNNFMSITAPVHENTNRLFKWDNDFAWSYDGNITDSIKEKVKRAGGNVTARMRVSLGWYNTDDLDIHVIEPSGNRIYYGNKMNNLDVDMNCWGTLVRDPVENVCWNNNIRDGVYTVLVNNFSKRENKDFGFSLEVEFEGHITHYSYDRPVVGEVKSLKLTVKNNVLVKIETEKDILSSSASQTKWGITTETLAKVNTLMYSPNYWDENKVGNKHWFFILEGCLNEEPIRGIYNEFLNSKLEKHRKVFEILGDKTKCPVTTEQLSGLGFSSTRGDKVQVLVKGTKLQKLYNINF